MREHHIDDVPDDIVEKYKHTFHHPQLGETGACLSCRRPADKKPIIVFGQDESIFKQFAFHSSVWYGTEGQQVLLPKDDGLGIMISAFQSREFGFGFHDISDDDLDKINKYREKPENEKYKDQDAAKEVLGVEDGKKGKLTKDLRFVWEFDYGKNKEGYWNYSYMVIQLEDCVDVVRALYGDDFEYVFLFDHSCGHDKKRTDGLDAGKMNVSFGGAQPRMRPSDMTAGCLGAFEHPNKLRVGDKQSFVYSSSDAGPFNLTPEQREDRKLDMVVPGELKKEYFNKEQLRKAIIDSEGGVPSNVPLRSRKDHQDYCKKIGIATFGVKSKVKEGWLNKPKGLLQVLWERGWIDPENHKSYSKNGTKKADGTFDVETSLSFIMANCEDFVNEVTLLQHMAKEMGAIVDRTPKCHAELAGEGIEYSWGKAKQYFRKININSRRGADNFFRQCVRKSISREFPVSEGEEAPLSTERIRKFSRRARRYIVAYSHWHTLNELGVRRPKESVQLIEFVVKNFKTHRNAEDFERAFIKQS